MRSYIYLLVLWVLCGKSYAQVQGYVYENKSVESRILNEVRKYAIYLPPDYESSERSYPVLYLLHPAGPKGTVPNQQGWINYGMLQHFMDKLIFYHLISLTLLL